MHTGQQLKQSLFSIRIDSNEASIEQLFPGWGPLDRLGIVVQEPFGALGASHLLQAAIVAFYDAKPGRRELSRRVYPEIYVFHVGGRFGEFVNFDVFPARKEVFLENKPASVLKAINDRGISWLAVPDRVPETAQHEWKEPAQALDRISGAWAYSADGRTRDGDVSISASSPLAQANTKMTLHASGSFFERQQLKESLGDQIVPDDELLVLPNPLRAVEVSPDDRDRIQRTRDGLGAASGKTETYRRIDVAEALRMLHRGLGATFAPYVSFADLQAVRQ